MNLEWLRLVNATLAVCCAGVYFLRINYTWTQVSHGVRVLRIGILGLMAVVAIASGGSYLRGVPVGLWVPAFTVVLLVILVGLWLARNERLLP